MATGLFMLTIAFIPLMIINDSVPVVGTAVDIIFTGLFNLASFLLPVIIILMVTAIINKILSL
jgi:hypothetical protein